ncbi:hypothetical protein RMR16_025000 (plasmid) [Agrobacterium sp. rho-13.3]|uniref:hypothetical protein n=1 Tax=Agrobacterium sp. rho-13.3 TaxID=3072980 RepID=UPI002A0F6EF0|nr:hypothetical protein [Agrobacterium sp. rho-13.3]MDX8310210.1 hypothetical protein [Agrobacterium sp. rho-13.3]
MNERVCIPLDPTSNGVSKAARPEFVTRNSQRLMFLVLGLAWVLPLPAKALDATEIVSLVNSVVEPLGMSIITSDATAVPRQDSSGIDVFLHRVALKSGPAETIALGDVTLESVKVADTGGYTIGRIQLPNLDLRDPLTTIVTNDVILLNCNVPKKSGALMPDDFMFCEGFQTGPVLIKDGQVDMFSFDRLEFNLTRMDGTAGLNFSGYLKNDLLYSMATERPETERLLIALGLTEIRSSENFSGSWHFPTGRFRLNENHIDIPDVGKISVAFDMAGLTQAWIKSFLTPQWEETHVDPDGALEDMDSAVSVLLAQLTLSGFSVEFQDNSLTRRAIDYFATHQGTSTEVAEMAVNATFSQFSKSLLPTDFAAAAGSALTRYIEEPNNIRIWAEPQKPVTFSKILETVESEPKAIIDLLNVSLSVNDRDRNSTYLERRNDLGIVAFCSGQGLLIPDAERYFRMIVQQTFRDPVHTSDGDVHEQKGREGIVFLQGYEQFVNDYAAAKGVGLQEVCDQYKIGINLMKRSVLNQK